MDNFKSGLILVSNQASVKIRAILCRICGEWFVGGVSFPMRFFGFPLSPKTHKFSSHPRPLRYRGVHGAEDGSFFSDPVFGPLQSEKYSHEDIPVGGSEIQFHALSVSTLQQSEISATHSGLPSYCGRKRSR